jgi:adenosylcobinamide-GDP ribazoletransferase
LSGLRTAWIFLTRVPIGDDPRPDVARAVPWFPIVGAVVGAIVAGVWAIGSELFGPLPSAAVAVATGALVTGAFHHDGLADMADAFGGGWSREQRLEILKDSRHGTYGVMALVCVVLVQVAALAVHGPAQGAAALVAAHCLGRAGAVVLLLVMPAAHGGGMGAAFAADARTAPCVAGAGAAVVVALVVLGPGGLSAAACVAIATALVGLLAWRKIGGLVGDVLGAAEQVGEAVVLLTTATLVHHEVGFPWWAS